jgi:Domain of unknown function (DUF397)
MARPFGRAFLCVDCGRKVRVRVDQSPTPPTWRKSRYCGSAACVEVAKVDGSYLVRDSKIPHSPVLSFTESEWDAFARGMRAGDFDFR